MAEPITSNEETINEDVKITQKEEIMIPKSRFDEVNKKYKQYQSQFEASDKAKAEEQGTWKELAEKNEKELKELKASLQSTNVISALTKEVAKLNPVNIDAVIKLVDQNQLTYDDGKVSGIEEALRQVQEQVPQLFTTEPPKNLGINKGNPASTGAIYYKKSQLSDPAFVAQNIEELDKARIEGRIVD